ncbi:sigma-70 family RNA polymerase sigma factor [Nocardia sp. NRRL S-836]|uniref:sigma-70 family RNA polymerase sigma factor n=1 Tax=Nocardia sp. NRRL S-836 TaxID=1519492 RepID=UPI0006B03591|nr:sigma-70 family RNA polymerase sigma factor [Nocardia sp. NRRL S-836]
MIDEEGAPRPPSDAELIDAVRGGTVEAYGRLYERHVRAALNLALQLTGSSADADDLVSDAFAKVLAALRTGGGPDASFRPYLLTAVRHTAYDKSRRDKRLELVGDVEEVPGATRSTSVQFSDTAVASLNQSLAATAFASLPERWQTVLWHTAIEGQSPGEVGPLLGLSANGVSAMAHRAREGLRRAYLQAHVARDPSERCRATVAKLGAWTRGGLSARESIQLDAHLDRCADCRAIAGELADVNGALRAVVAPLVLGGAAAGYLGFSKAGALASAGASSWFTVAAASTAVVIVVTAGVSAPLSPPRAAPAAPPATSSASTTPSAGLTTTTVAGVPTTQPGASAPSTATSGAAQTGATNTVDPGAPGTTEQGAPAAAPSLALSSPSDVSMPTGGQPTTVTITVSNTGSAPSAPVSLTLTLPDEIKTVGAGSTGAGEVGCPAGKGQVTCSTGAVAAGGSVRFVLRLHAGPKAADGVITGVTDTGLRVRIQVTITSK